jgi:hypothetical protein
LGPTEYSIPEEGDKINSQKLCVLNKKTKQDAKMSRTQ